MCCTPEISLPYRNYLQVKSLKNVKHCERGCLFVFILTMMFAQTQPNVFVFVSPNQMAFLWCLNPTQHLCGLTYCGQTMEQALRKGGKQRSLWARHMN